MQRNNKYFNLPNISQIIFKEFAKQIEDLQFFETWNSRPGILLSCHPFGVYVDLDVTC